MSEFVVHFTKATIRPPDTDDTPYWQHLGILWDGQLTPSEKRWGAARDDERLGDSQRAVCFSEVPLAFAARIADRRGSSYGLGFTQEFVRRQGAVSSRALVRWARKAARSRVASVQALGALWTPPGEILSALAFVVSGERKTS